MKRKNTSHKMRLIAGYLYGILSVLQIMLLYSAFGGALTSSAIAWMIEILLAIAVAALSVWLISDAGIVKRAMRRAVVVATVFVVAFEIVTYNMQTVVITYTLLEFLPSLVINGSQLWPIIFFGVRILLIVLGAFFFTSAKEEEELENWDGNELEDVAMEMAEEENLESPVKIVEEDVVLLVDNEDGEKEELKMNLDQEEKTQEE